MNKEQFLIELASALSGLPEEDVEKSLEFYSEMIDDRIEDGLTEEEAVSELGTIEEIRAQIIKDTPLSKIVKEKVKPKRTLRTWEILLLILGAPLWLPLLIAAASVLLAVYIVIWSVVVVLFSVDITFFATAIGGGFGSLVLFLTDQTLAGLLLLGGGITCAGLCILWFFICLATVKGIISVSKHIILGIKSVFITKGDN